MSVPVCQHGAALVTTRGGCVRRAAISSSDLVLAASAKWGVARRGSTVPVAES